MLSQLTNIHIGINNVVNTIYTIDIPSTPNTKFIFNWSNHSIFVTYCNSPFPSFILNHNHIDAMNVVTEIPNAPCHPLIFSSFVLKGNKANTIVPITGIIYKL